jgi:hypothetical protein
LRSSIFIRVIRVIRGRKEEFLTKDNPAGLETANVRSFPLINSVFYWIWFFSGMSREFIASD